ncbi:Ig-like domain-containing protein [Alcanivorax sp. 24]|uniref:Ig-like domain-containing protein n=1 Tax=Alcanivorax sp. 24 TaxID=2545266 RepID=UPI001060624C|nr:Ig-like domain-containing protein [Alcanivorax sp. 24]
MNTLTLKRGGLLIASALILSACGGGGGSDMPGPGTGDSKTQSLLYAYPDNGQTEVPTPVPVVLRFSSAVTVDDAEAAITLHEGDASGPTLAATFSTVDGEPRGLVLNPDDKLKPLTDYTVVIRNLKLEKGTAANQVVSFTTRPLHEGPRSLVVSSDDFVIERRIPDGGSSEPVMDFSTFRFQFSQPIDPATVHYGDAPASSTAPADNVGLYDSQGNLVDAVLVVNDRYMTVDPNPQSDDPENPYFTYLTPGENYTLRLGDGITSVYGETFGGDEIAFTPKDSSPRGEPGILVQRITDSANRTNLSPLTGKPINEVPVNGVLLGEDANITQASNNAVMAELADVTQYPDVTPIRLPRNTVLDGSSIDVLIGGHVPAGFSSGQVEMRMLSDATGYLVPNPYNSNRSDALRIVHLFMDVAIATEDPRTNGAFTQDILHIELIGTAAVDTTEGVLNIDAVSVVEPNVLGQEYGYGLLSFQLQSYKDQQNPPVDAVAEMEDNQPPVLQSWTLGDYEDLATNQLQPKSYLYQPGDPIIINFNEPLNIKTLAGKLSLYENGSPINIDYRTDGAALVIYPENPLSYDKENTPIEYELTFDPAGVEDLSGNALSTTDLGLFRLPLQVENREQVVFGTPTGALVPTEKRSPLVLSAYPGFPCALDPDTTDLANDDSGRCLGGFPGLNSGTEYDMKPEDDHIPVMHLPGNMPIIVTFSKNIDPKSVLLGDSFIVESINPDGSIISEVSGNIEIHPRSITFYPDQPWSKGQLYRYSLASNGDINSSSAICDGTGSICDGEGLPLQTQILGEISISEVDPPNPSSFFPPEREYKTLKTKISSTAGGPSISQYFRGGDFSNSVIQQLVAAPSSDTNANFIHEANEAVGDGVFAIEITDIYRYQSEESGAFGQPLDPKSDPELDPNGVLPPPNSAKIVSRDTKGLPPSEAPVLNGVNVGCGYASTVPWDESDPFNSYGIPMECPEQKFTYLTGALTALVTNTYDQDNGIKVEIMPAQIMSTALTVRQHAGTYSFLIASSGAQVMRMRYEEDENGQRTMPVTGHITNGPNGKPLLKATVDLYVDAPELSEVGLQFNEPSHSLISYPITMELSGEVSFLDDGRMLIDQYNLNPVDIDIRVQVPDGSWGGSMLLRIPAYGNRLQYISSPIKQ